MKNKIPSNLSQYTKVAVKAALSGGAVLQKYYNKQISVSYKGRIDPVTIADKTSQKAVYSVIKKHFPKHTVVGEEDKKKIVCEEYCWIVDPLDGTVNFIHGVPMFCVSIALTRRGRVISGVIYAPQLDEMFVTEKSKGAWLNGKKINVSKIKDKVRSLAITGFPYDIHSKSSSVIKKFKGVLTSVQGLRRFGSAAIDLAYVSCGRAEVFWEENLHAWDVAAGSLLVQEAGGKVSDFKNKEDYLWGKNILATNGHMHNSMLKLIKRK